MLTCGQILFGPNTWSENLSGLSLFGCLLFPESDTDETITKKGSTLVFQFSVSFVLFLAKFKGHSPDSRIINTSVQFCELKSKTKNKKHNLSAGMSLLPDEA